MQKLDEKQRNFAMSTEEEAVKDWLIYDVLGANGYKTFATHLINYNLYLTEDPMIAASMQPSTGSIYLNRYFEDEDLISVLIRHELLHFLLDHERHAIIDLAEEEGLDPHHLKKSDYKRLRQMVYSSQIIPGFESYGPVSFTNVAGDYDLSRYYSKVDMDRQKNGLFYGSPLGGLVLELDHPEWLSLSYRELIHKLKEIERDARRAALVEISGVMQDDMTFVPDIVDKVEDETGVKVDTPDKKSTIAHTDKSKEISDKDIIDALEKQLLRYDSWSKTSVNKRQFSVYNWGDWDVNFDANSDAHYTLSDRYKEILDKILIKLEKSLNIKINYNEDNSCWIYFKW